MFVGGSQTVEIVLASNVSFPSYPLALPPAPLLSALTRDGYVAGVDSSVNMSGGPKDRHRPMGVLRCRRGVVSLVSRCPFYVFRLGSRFLWSSVTQVQA